MLMLPTLPLRTILAAALAAAAAAAAAAAPAPAGSRDPGDWKADTRDGAKKKILIGGGPTGMVGAADFDGESFDIVANYTVPGTSASWLLFKEPNLLYAVDENSNTTRLFNFDPDTNDLALVQNATGSSGVVFLEFNLDKSVMVGAAFGEGQVDVWDLDGTDGTMTLRKQIPAGGDPGPVVGRQDSPHPHEALLDPTGQFFVVPDLGTDTLLVIDTKDFDIQSRVTIDPPGAGPRHGSFFPLGTGGPATHFFLACEIASLVKVFELDYTAGGGLAFREVQSRSTFGSDTPPANATTASAGELVIAADNKNLYVSNRLTGNTTDSISHFSIDTALEEPLSFVDQISSGGLVPRMFSLSKDDGVLFSTNQDGENGLLAFARDTETGSLAEEPIATVAREQFGAPNLGPQFVMEVGEKGSNS